MLDQSIATLFEQEEDLASGDGYVLIVDDDQDHSEALAHGLAKQGFQPLIARTVSTAVLMTGMYRPRVIILDVNLPDGSGLELCESLNDAPETCDIPVIVLSGNGEADIVRRARHAGCDFYIHKPHDPKALLTLVNDSIQRNSVW
ncbi:MAG: response regulator [Planctomycetales bacterium]|nr:response regulator [Planctomycetales bacterium]